MEHFVYVRHWSWQDIYINSFNPLTTQQGLIPILTAEEREGKNDEVTCSRPQNW